MVEQATENRCVGGSIPPSSTSWFIRLAVRSPPFQGGSTGSNPVWTIAFGQNAQVVER
jgi:hypothetical protein